MKFLDAIPEYESFNDVPNSKSFLSCGQPELCRFLKSFLVLDDVRIQAQNIDEIKKWLKEHPECEYYLIVDDEDDIIPEQKDHLIQTDGNIGFTLREYTLCQVAYEKHRECCELPF